MWGKWRRSALSLIVVVASLSGAAIGAEPAQASSVQSGQVTFSGDPGNGLIAGGQVYSYATSQGAGMNAAQWQPNPLLVYSTNSADFWEIEFAPPPGQKLTVGTYTDAVRYPFQDVGQPGLEFMKDDGGCNMATGNFTIYQLVLGADGSSVDSLNATFEFHCEGQTPAIRGRVLINVAGPPMLAMNLNVSATGAVSAIFGSPPRQRSFVTVNGTVTCTQAAQLKLTGTIAQITPTATPPLTGTVACIPGSAVPWTASGWLPPINPPSATLTVTVSSVDPYYMVPASTTRTTPQIQLIQSGWPPAGVPQRLNQASAPGQSTAPTTAASPASQLPKADDRGIDGPIPIKHHRNVHML